MRSCSNVSSQNYACEAQAGALVGGLMQFMPCNKPFHASSISEVKLLALLGTTRPAKPSLCLPPNCEALGWGLAGGVCRGLAQCCPVCGVLDDCAAAAMASPAALLLWPWCSCQVLPRFSWLLSRQHQHFGELMRVYDHDCDAGDTASA